MIFPKFKLLTLPSGREVQALAHTEAKPKIVRSARDSLSRDLQIVPVPSVSAFRSSPTYRQTAPIRAATGGAVAWKM